MASGGAHLSSTRSPMHLWETSDGVRIAADSFGTPGRPAIVMLHGGGQTRHSWRRSAKRLAGKGFYVVAFDTRGHGDSDWSAEGDYHEAALIYDLECVSMQAGLTRPVVVGASAGGATALAAIGTGRIDAAALILVDIVPRTEDSGFLRLRQFMREQSTGYASLDEAAAAIAAFRPDARPPRSTARLARNLRKRPDGRLYWHWDPAYLKARDIDRLDRLVRLSGHARNVAVPTLLIRGENSDVVSEEGAREFLSLCPLAEFVSIPDAGHVIVGDPNDPFGEAALPFLARLDLHAGQ